MYFPMFACLGYYSRYLYSKRNVISGECFNSEVVNMQFGIECKLITNVQANTFPFECFKYEV